MARRPQIARYRITLCFTRPASFRFLHGAAVHGLLCRALALHPLPPQVIPYAPESGRVRYEPGDRYNLGLTLVGEAQELLDRVLSGLMKVGSERPTPDHPLPTFAGNFQVVSCDALPPPDLEAEVETLRDAPAVTVRFLSPLRMRRPAPLRRPGEAFFNARCFPLDVFLKRVALRCQALGFAHVTHPCTAHLGPGAAQLTWLDLPVRGKSAQAGTSAGLTLGGVVGTLEISGPDLETCRLLALGRHLHVGEGVHFGCGRFELDVPAAEGHVFPRAATLQATIAQETRLAEALHHVVRQSDAPGVDGLAPGTLMAQGDRFLAELRQDLERGTYAPSPLLGVLLPKTNGGFRALAIPTARDRVAQRAACDLVTPALHTLLEDSSYAYRKGLSRAAAAVALQRAYDEGYHYLLDADIESFFDSVRWDILFAKLEALYPYEPLLATIKAWVTAPVVFSGKTVVRTQGLPQGAVISPLLANLYLDQLDEELQSQGFRLVRYADDFVILCRTPKEAEKAQEAAREALARLGLELNPQKTAVKSFEGGFSYLGYLFCRSLVVEKKKSLRLEQDGKPLAVPKGSWLASLPLADLRQLTPPTPGSKGSPPVAPGTLANLASERPSRRPLYILDPAATLALEGETLTVSSPTQEPLRIGLHTLSHVVVVGRSRATLPALLALAQRRVPIFFCRRTGELYAQLQPHAPSWALWRAQAELTSNPAACVAFARSVVQAKLHNAATLATRHKLQGWGELGEKLRELEKSALQQNELPALLGLEGKGAALFYACLAASLPAHWGFAGRRRNPPPDPVNAMLSLAYTVLYNHVATALIAGGLDPRWGIFHRPRGTYYALACDLQEELRHLAEGFVIAGIRRREVQPEDFLLDAPGPFPCLFRPEARRRFLLGFEKRLATAFTPRDDERMSYLEFIDRQAQALRAFIEGKGAYDPLRLHA